MYEFTILGTLPNLNEYTKANRTNKFAGSKMKKNATLLCRYSCGLLPIITKPFILSCTYYEKNKRKDPDNITHAKKYILDGLVQAGKIKNDGWNEVIGFEDSWQVDKENPRVEVEIKIPGKYL